MGIARRAPGALFMMMIPAAGIAQERPDTARVDTAIVALPELIVRGTAPIAAATTVGGASAIHARIDSLALPAAPTFEGVLRAIPMVHVRRNSRGEAEISVRGSESRQVAVLVDGIPLTLAWDARADVSVIPATGAQEVNFVRGVSSMLYGPNVLGGIVEIAVGQTLFQPSSASAEVAAEVDHRGGVGGRGAVTLPFASDAGMWLVRAGTSRRDSPGIPLARGVVEPVPAANRLRVNTDAESLDGFLSVRYRAHGGAWWSFFGSTFSAERGIAAELGVEDARFWRYPHVARTLMIASGGTGDRASPFGGRGDLEASVGVDIGRTEIDAYTDRTYTQLDGFEDGDDRTMTVRLLGDQTLGPRAELRGAFTLSDIRHHEFLPDGDARYAQRLWSVGGETVWRAIESGRGVNWLRVSVGGAYDAGQTPETGGREPLGTLSEWGARLGATMGLMDGDMLVHASVSRRGRFPALRELYSGALNRFAPNPNLRPENLVAIEGGFTTRVGAGEFQAVAFRHQLNDAVVRITLPDRRFLRVNRNQLRSTGVELIGSVPLGRVVLGGDATLQSVALTDPEAGVTNEPENLPEVAGGLRAAFSLPLDVRGSAEARYTGRQFCIDPGTGLDTELDGGTVLNGELARTWWVDRSGAWFRRIETRVAVDNAGAHALYDQCGLPQAGRLFRFQVRVY